MKLVIAIPCLLRGGTEIQTLTLVRAVKMQSAKSELQTAKDEARTTRDDGRTAIPDFQSGRISGFEAVTVVCYFEFDPEVVAEFEAAGAKVRLLQWDRKRPAWRVVGGLKEVFRQEEPDIVHVQYIAPAFLAIVAARLAGMRQVVATVHQPGTPYGWKARLLLRSAAKLCRVFLCVSEAAERSWFGSSQLYVPRFPLPRHCTIHNAIDLDRLDAVLSARTPAGERLQAETMNTEAGRAGFQHFGDQVSYFALRPLTFGTVARLSREKGVDVLITAFAQALKQIPHARLVIVGDGPERAALEAQAAGAGLSQGKLDPSDAGDHMSEGCTSRTVRRPSSAPQLLWAGRQSWEHCIRLMAMMDVVVVSSRFEGFGLTAAEAMACGKPVVASDLDGLAEVLGFDSPASYGIHFAAGDADALTAALLELAESPPRRVALGAAARKRVESRFSQPLFRQQMLSVYSATGAPA
jgi:glycosyltransferase involved in cell wall biosynthesis